MGKRPLIYIGSCEKDIGKFPLRVKDEVIFGLLLAQEGLDFSKERHPQPTIDIKPLKGFGSSKVREIRIGSQNATFRVIYTVEYENALYVLHAFQKKSKKGIQTPQQDVELIKRRLKVAEEDYKIRTQGGK